MTQEGTFSAARAQILVVDDEPTPRMAITEALNLMGYRADDAASGTEALEMLSSRHYDLMLLDLRMPGMDGVEVMKRARQAYADLLVIVLTAYGSLESAIEAVRAGASDYLLKPSSIRDTEAAIDATLRRRTELKPSSPFEGDVDGAGLVISEAEAVLPAGVERKERFIRQGRLALDREKNLFFVAQRSGKGSFHAQLTACEAALLQYLMQHPNQVLSCRDLARHALDYDLLEREAQAIVRPHISRLRRKLEPGTDHPGLIRTIRRKGYLFSAP